MKWIVVAATILCGACGSDLNPAGPSPVIPTPDPNVKIACDYLPGGEPYRCKIVEETAGS